MHARLRNVFNVNGPLGLKSVLTYAFACIRTRSHVREWRQSKNVALLDVPTLSTAYAYRVRYSNICCHLSGHARQNNENKKFGLFGSKSMAVSICKAVWLHGALCQVPFCVGFVRNFYRLWVYPQALLICPCVFEILNPSPFIAYVAKSTMKASTSRRMTLKRRVLWE